jgi:hypothetical protein
MLNYVVFCCFAQAWFLLAQGLNNNISSLPSWFPDNHRNDLFKASEAIVREQIG